MTELPPPDSFDDHTLTEYIETLMLVEEVEHLSMAELLSRFPSGQRPSSSDVGLIRSEVNRRAYMLPTLYPYRADDAGIQRLATPKFRAYDFMILLSLERAPYRRESRFNEANRLFDFIVREAMKAMIGPNGRAVRFGTPVQDGRPEKFQEAIPWLADLMGVATGTPDLPVDDNDGGVDIVAWQPFMTGRSAYPVWLIQGTLQIDYESKAHQIPVAFWVKALDIGPTPQTALAIPFTIKDGDDRWMKIALVTPLILERIRICELFESTPPRDFAELDEINEFVEQELVLLRAGVESEGGGVARVVKPRRQRPSSNRDPLRR